MEYLIVIDLIGLAWMIFSAVMLWKIWRKVSK